MKALFLITLLLAPESDSAKLKRLFEEHWARSLRENPSQILYEPPESGVEIQK